MWSWLHPYSGGFIPPKCGPVVGIILKYSWLHHPRFLPVNISATLSNYAMWFVHIVPDMENSVYAKDQLCSCPSSHINSAVSIRSLWMLIFFYPSLDTAYITNYPWYASILDDGHMYAQILASVLRFWIYIYINHHFEAYICTGCCTYCIIWTENICTQFTVITGMS